MAGVEEQGPLKSATAAERQAPGPDAGVWRKAGFWRAVAGMGLAATLACAIVAAEAYSILIHRSAIYRRHLTHLTAEFHRISREMAVTTGKIDSMREQLVRSERLRQILSASDLRLLKLAPPKPDRSSSGLVAISRNSKSAVLDAAGLSPLPEDKVYELWWILAHGGPVKAAAFRAGADGRAIVAAELPPQGDQLLAGMVTLDAARGASRPSSMVELKGAAD